jgi:hypothetical protein
MALLQDVGYDEVSGPPRRTSGIPSTAALVTAGCSAAALLPALANPSLAYLGYVFGALLAPLLVVVHRFAVRSAARDLYYVVQPRLKWVAMAALTIGVCAGAGHAWLIATALAKQ